MTRIGNDFVKLETINAGLLADNAAKDATIATQTAQITTQTANNTTLQAQLAAAQAVAATAPDADDLAEMAKVEALSPAPVTPAP